MKKSWFYGIGLAGAAMLGAAVAAWAQVNPPPGSLWTWMGPTYGASWLPLDQALNMTTPIKVNPQLLVGTPGWMTTINGCTENCATTSSLSNIGGIGVMGASRSSTYTGPGPASQTIGLMGYGYNNHMTTSNVHAWGGITVGRRGLGIPLTNQVISMEVDVHENNDMAGSNFITPSAITPANGSLSAGLWVASGDGYSGVPHDASAAVGVINNGAKFMSGIVFGATALVNRGPSGQAFAIELADGHALRWTGTGLSQMMWADSSGLHGIGNHGAVIPPSQDTSWGLSGNYYTQGEVNFWNGQNTPGPRVFSFHKKITNTTESELASIGWGGELRSTKGVVAGAGGAPGAGFGSIQWVAGTNAGTCKLVALAGTSLTPVTIVDNVGAGC